MTTNYSLLNWENPNPYDAGYWLALRDALRSRRIATGTILAGHHTPFNNGQLAGALITAIRGAMTLWSDTAEATSWALFGRSFLSVAEAPIRGYAIGSDYWSAMLILLHGAILKLRYRRVDVLTDNSWGYSALPPYSFFDSVYESIEYYYPLIGGASIVSPISEARLIVARFIVDSVDKVNAEYYQVVGQASITNPLHVAGTAHVIASPIDSSNTPFDAFGTGFAEGDNEFAIPIGKTVILEDTTPPRLPDTNAFYDGATPLEGRGCELSEYAWIDYGESLILTAD